MPSKIKELSQHPFFENIDAEQAKTLTDSARISNLPDKTVVFEEGDRSDALYLILEGRVAFRKRLPSGDFLTVSYSNEGDHFGEVGVLTKEKRSLRAEAAGDVVIARLDGRALKTFLKNLPGPIEAILQSVIHHLHETTRHYVEDMLHREKMAVVGAMVNSIIHDFKNPFCLISLSAQILRHKNPDPETTNLCNNIEGQVDRMVEMARELSEFSRGETRLNKTRLNLRDLLLEFQKLNFPYFESDGITITVNVPSVEFFAEKAKILRVFQNLVGNAVDAIGEGPGQIHITGSVVPNQNVLEIEIRDTGKGIPESIRNNFFDPFITHGKKEGTGLGSAIVKSIIDSHGGQISFRTETGKGTIFTIRLPRG